MTFFENILNGVLTLLFRQVLGIFISMGFLRGFTKYCELVFMQQIPIHQDVPTLIMNDQLQSELLIT